MARPSTDDASRVPEPERVDRILPSHLAPGCLSVVVFGPGRGEAIVVVLPDGAVGVVDGCREPVDPHTGQGDPVRSFLAEWRRQAESSGKRFRLPFVCLTHPHDDHYAGLGHLMDAYQGSIEHVWSVVESGNRYAEALSHYVESTKAGREPLPDIREVRGLERFLHGQARAVNEPATRFKYLLQDVSLLEYTIPFNAPVLVKGCGPVHKDVHFARDELFEAVSLLERGEESKARFDPNVTSGVLQVCWGGAGVLLGGDLVLAKGRYRGWDDIASGIKSPVQVIKVSHHASEEAHHEELWARLGAHLAIVTPFKEASGSMPPRPEQINRLARDAVVAITAVPDWKPSARNPRPKYLAESKSGRRTVPAARNKALKHTRKSGEVDLHNAVAVSLDATGRIVRFVLAGKANVYEPPAAPPTRARTGT